MLSFASSVRTNIFLDSKEVAAGEAMADWGTVIDAVIDACVLGTQVSDTLLIMAIHYYSLLPPPSLVSPSFFLSFLLFF